MAINKQLYEDNGVVISKSAIKEGDEITLSYSGLLANSGADMIYAYIGYGEDWTDSSFISMDSKEGIFSVAYTVTQPGSMNVCFKDSANNWDNNNAQNYTFKVAKKASRAAVAKTEAKAEVKKGDETAKKVTVKAESKKTASTAAKPKAAKKDGTVKKAATTKKAVAPKAKKAES